MAAAGLEDRLGHRFADSAALQRALTHRSWCAEIDSKDESAGSNERLEFLGDAVLDLIVTHELFERFPDRPEGELTKIRAEVVGEATLAALGRDLGLGPALRLGKGEAASGGRDKASLLADAAEAVIAAVYLDGGIEAARRLVLGRLDDRIDAAVLAPGRSDYKTRLQEEAARLGLDPPRYEVSGAGPDHDKRFRASVSVGPVQGWGEGSTKKAAEQRAASSAWAELEARP